LAREAVSTSALEGTYGALPDVLEARLPKMEPKSREVKEIRGYEQMARFAFKWIAEGRPITVGMLSDLQGILAKESRSPARDPGKVREHQVFIGPQGSEITEAWFVPPPPGDQLVAGVNAWQEWVNAERAIPVVVACALAHYQFESLHPFGDGNGRVGRLVIVLQLLKAGALPEPALTISPWLLRNRSAYQAHLLQLSVTGVWDPWVRFFSKAVHEQCDAHVRVAQQLLEWLTELRRKLATRGWGGVILELGEDLIDWPVINAPFAQQKYGKSAPTIHHAIERLVEIGELVELTGSSYRRVYGAQRVMDLVESL
jgi:Fic family protein